MILLDATATRRALPWTELVSALRRQFAEGCEMPLRHHHTVEQEGEPPATLLLMPAWEPGGSLGVKLVTVTPGNSQRGLPVIAGSYVLFSAVTGAVEAIIDGAELTARCTAATSALAADYLARPDARRLLVVGAGKLSLNLVQAHATVRAIESVAIWARRPEQAEEVAAEARALGFDAAAATDIDEAVAQADIISCCTLSRVPLVRGAFVRPGTHLDLIGAYRHDMRETDDAAMQRARLFADTREGVMGEGGDVLQAIASGAIAADALEAELADLVRGTKPGRRTPGEVTAFKSVGAALEDLAGATLAFRNAAAAGAA